MSNKQWIGLCLVVIGLAMCSYYFVEWYSAKNSAKSLTEEEVKQYKESKQEKDEVPHAEETLDLSTEVSHVQTPASQVQHQFGEKIAYLIIPKIKQKYSVYWGADDKVLKKGVGMFVSDLTTAPSGNGHTVLSGHRDTVFTELGQLQENDNLTVEYDQKVYTYQIQRHWITDAEDRTVIVEKDKPTLTLTTCYPFDFIGDAPDRYIIEADLISTTLK
ncbi:class D sortase [Bacillus sp. NPDC094077]|uniref:class D sortase n=1 Tax=Bacillus sp. NPDC094077 TaxID=3390932 RepID=UPI003D00233D